MADSADTQREAHERATAFREAVNGSAATARGLYFTYLLLGAYVGVTIASTTDEQLLLVSPVTLPILDIELPIVAFYAVVPWLLALMHVYLVLQLYLLARQVHLFDHAIERLGDEGERAAQRTLLFPFPFVHMLAGERSGPMRMTHAAIVWITLIWLPLLLVLSTQVRFLPYHDPLVTSSARMALLFQLAVLWAFWPRILTRDATGAGIRERGRSRLVAWWRRAARREPASGGPHGRPLADGVATLTATSAAVLVFSWLVAVLPGEGAERWMAYWLPAPGVAQTAGPAGNRLTYWVFDGPNAPLHRNLELPDRLLIASTLEPQDERAIRRFDSLERARVLEKVVGVDLSSRDLRHANFYGAVLPHADLRGANLDGADLRFADLEGVDMRPREVAPADDCVEASQKHAADARGTPSVDFVAAPAFYCASSARGASFGGARLRWASAQLALLEDADFSRSDVRDVNLDGADVRRALLRRTNLADSTFAGADLRRVRILGDPEEPVRIGRVEGLDLSGADIRNVRLDGSRIASAPFSRFVNVSLQLADLSGGDFRGAVFSHRTDLRGADMAGADVRGATFEDVDLRGVDLSKASADLARFARAGACMADLTGTSLRGAEWSDSALHGASLAGADLRYTRISQVGAHGADLRSARLGPFALFALTLDFADVRQLAALTADDVPALRETAEDLRAGQRPASAWQDDTLAAIAAGQLTATSPHEVGAMANQPVLCDGTSAALPGNLALHCVGGGERLRFLQAALPAACGDPNVMGGIIRQSGTTAGLRLTRGGVLEPGPERDVFETLVAGIDRCPEVVEHVDAMARQVLQDIRAALENTPSTSAARAAAVITAACR